jgi:hypothetical protein
MLSIYSFKRKMVLVVTMILASLAVTMMAQPAHAQDIVAVRRSIVSTAPGSKLFSIDSSGRMRRGGDFTLEITRLDDSGALVGKYYSSGTPAPATTNVTGSINIIRGGAATGTIGNAIGISFTVTQRAGFGVNETVFEGALRVGTSREPSFGFMAGTYSATFVGGVGGERRPFPFCAMLTLAPG